MFYLSAKQILQMSRPHRDLEQDWQELRTWVQENQAMIRLNGVALKAGVSPELVTMLLLRPIEKSTAARGWERLDALLEVLMQTPFNYCPRWVAQWAENRAS